jgi:hypothetical protein
VSTEFPTHTLIAIVVVMVAAAGAAWFTLSQALARLPLPRRTRTVWRWSAAVVLGGWLLARLTLAIDPPGGSFLVFFPYTAAFVAFGTVVGLGALVLSPVFRQLVRTAPQTWLIGTQAIRVAGFLFLALLDMGRLPAEFALPAGYGDMAVGLLALATVAALASGKPYARWLVLGVNLLGLLDFVSAFATGLAFIGPFARQLQSAGVSPLYLNYVLIVPAFGVPLYALMHVYSLFQLFSPRPVHEEVSRWSVRPLAS